jgi:hypothetical protein
MSEADYTVIKTVVSAITGLFGVMTLATFQTITPDGDATGVEFSNDGILGADNTDNTIFANINEYVEFQFGYEVLISSIRLELHSPYGYPHDGNGRLKVAAYKFGQWVDVWEDIATLTEAGWQANTSFNTVCSAIRVIATTIDTRGAGGSGNYLREVEVNYV